MRNYEKYFEGYAVPERLKMTAVCIMRRFSIFGICDGMYICNVIAFESGFGDGECHFSDKVDINIPRSVDRLKNAYGCNISRRDTEELAEILRTGKLNIPKAAIGLRDFIYFTGKEMRTCEAWRKDYLRRCTEEAERTLDELAVGAGEGEKPWRGCAMTETDCGLSKSVKQLDEGGSAAGDLYSEVKFLDYIVEFARDNNWDYDNVPAQIRSFFTAWCFLFKIDADTRKCDEALYKIYWLGDLEEQISYEDFDSYMCELIL